MTIDADWTKLEDALAECRFDDANQAAMDLESWAACDRRVPAAMAHRWECRTPDAFRAYVRGISDALDAMSVLAQEAR